MTNSRTKGKVGELEAAKLWQRWFPDCRRSLRQVRKGYEQPDLIGDIERHFFVEVKRYKTITQKMLDKFWRKAEQDQVLYEALSGISTPVVLMHRADRKSWKISLTYWTWRSILGQRNSVGSTNYVMGLNWEDFAETLDTYFKKEKQ